MRARSALAAAGLAAALVLSGCAGGGTEAGAKGYVGGDGNTTLLAASERQPLGEIEGETVEGEPVSLADYRGKVVVVNVWGSWCAECRVEAPLLTEVAEQMEGDDVAFLGINTRDASPSQAANYQRTFDVPYPSLYDPAGRSLLAFAGTLPPNAIPSTAIIDAEGRVAGSIIGEVTSARTLVGMIEDVRDGESS